MLSSKEAEMKTGFREKVQEGSYTVEAAFVVPIVIFVLLSLIYMSFYLYDKVKIQSVLDSEVVEAVALIKHEVDPDTQEVDCEHLDDRGLYFSMFGSLDREEVIVEERVRKKLEEGLFLCQLSDVKAELSRSRITITATAHANIRLLQIKEYFTRSGTDLVLTGKGKVHYPAEFARRLFMLEGMDGKKEEYEKTKKSLQGKIEEK